MLKRILTLSLGVALGSVLALGGVHLASLWGFPHRSELDSSSAYYRQVMQLVEENYVDPTKTDPDEMTRTALEGMLQGLDPHSQFMRAQDYESLQEDLDSKFGGIGVQIERREGDIVVIAPISGTPGERAGILRGDRILSVNGESMRGRPLDDVVSRMRGKPGTPVDVAFGRQGRDEPLDLTIIREVIKVESVTDVAMLSDAIGYVHITQFAEPTADELHSAIARLESQGMRALILDVRSNPGGLLSSVAGALQPFFQHGDLMVYTQGRKAEDREEYRSELQGAPWHFPVAVLINAGSASAAEIMAGALKDAGKAAIVGERSFGKGSVQSVFRLHHGEGLRLTTARYYTPSGVTIHEHGVEPQVEVVMTPEEDGRVALQRARNDITDPAEFEKRFGFAPIADRQLDAAAAILQAALLLEGRKATGS